MIAKRLILNIEEQVTVQNKIAKAAVVQVGILNKHERGEKIQGEGGGGGGGSIILSEIRSQII